METPVASPHHRVTASPHHRVTASPHHRITAVTVKVRILAAVASLQPASREPSAYILPLPNRPEEKECGIMLC
ncbi:hypothetical protein OUZ56_029537 [Daphnia magna]|uniref:Uncharacterized protein n=1 Tax=Daphnia magna TaxID=35525 RepID=A0ABR0B748_9CRUS|nr:hypothetical protein OUZ56_029537 [Daphnia magna]